MCGFRLRRRTARAQLGETLFDGFDLGTRGRQRREVGVDRRELLAQRRGFGDERLDDAFVGDGGKLTVEAALPLGDEVGQPRARVRAALRHA